MAFNDLSFLFIFFPLFLLLHSFLPMKGKNILLLVLSLLFFAWGSPQYLVLMVLIILFNFFSGLRMGAQKEANNPGGAKLTLISTVILDLLLLGFFIMRHLERRNQNHTPSISATRTTERRGDAR